jgi:hypothetical protein
MNIIRKTINGIGAFLVTAGKSCYDMEFYRGVRTRPVKAALWYAAGLHLALTLLASMLFVPATLGVRAALSEYLTKTVPESASVSISHGQLSTTLSVPYELGSDSFHVIVDPSQEGTTFPEKLKTVGILFGRDAVFVRNAADTMQVKELKTIPDVTVSRDMVMGWLSRFSGWALVLAVALFTVLFWIMFFGSTVVKVALYALFAWLFGKLWKTNLRYSAWFACGLYAVTLPILVNILFGAMALPIPFAFTVIYFLIMGSIMTDERSQPTSGAAHVPMAAEMVADEEIDPKLPDAEKNDVLVDEAEGTEEAEEKTDKGDDKKDDDKKPPQ